MVVWLTQNICNDTENISCVRVILHQLPDLLMTVENTRSASSVWLFLSRIVNMCVDFYCWNIPNVHQAYKKHESAVHRLKYIFRSYICLFVCERFSKFSESGTKSHVDCNPDIPRQRKGGRLDAAWEAGWGPAGAPVLSVINPWRFIGRRCSSPRLCCCLTALVWRLAAFLLWFVLCVYAQRTNCPIPKAEEILDLHKCWCCSCVMDANVY